MKVVRTIAETREALAPLREGSIGLVPTMGSLHEGHLALLHAARAESDTVVMSLFVNPAQFGDDADLVAATRGTRPATSSSRATQASTSCSLRRARRCTRRLPDLGRGDGAGEMLEGRFRPGHFRGVATVVLKLFQDREADERVLRSEGRAAGRPSSDS